MKELNSQTSGGSRSLLSAAVTSSHIWLPLLIIVVLAVPIVTYMLPAHESYLGENYQPLRALKFFHGKGSVFHKYGPMPNLLLAPAYGASLGYWYANGTLASPSDDFPYGFQRPLRQLSFLIFIGRLQFLLLSLALLCYFLHSLEYITKRKLAASLAFLFCIATNCVAVTSIPNTRPDGVMLAFTAAALAVYVRIIHFGLTPRRTFWLSILAVSAVSSKELAAPMFVLPYLGVGWLGWRASRSLSEQRSVFWKSVLVGLVTGVVSYALLNVVYAPGTWWRRIEFWGMGPGKDTAVWGGLGVETTNVFDYAIRIGQTFLNNLGPGGIVATTVAVIVLVLTRPRYWLLWCLPFLSVLSFGLIPMGYARDRFYSIAALALALPVAAGLGAVLTAAQSRRTRRWLVAILAVPVMADLCWASFTSHALRSKAPCLIERYVIDNVPRSETVYELTLYPVVPGKSRLEWLGYKLDTRSLQQLVDSEADRPDWIFVMRGLLGFIEDCALLPGRAEYLKVGAGFDFEKWRGMESLGYSQALVLEPRTPSWFFFDWMPMVQRWKRINAVLVFQKVGLGAGRGSIALTRPGRHVQRLVRSQAEVFCRAAGALDWAYDCPRRRAGPREAPALPVGNGA